MSAFDWEGLREMGEELGDEARVCRRGRTWHLPKLETHLPALLIENPIKGSKLFIHCHLLLVAIDSGVGDLVWQQDKYGAVPGWLLEEDFQTARREGVV